MSDERYTGSRAEASADALAAELAERFTERLRLFAARRLRDASAAEDVAQDALREVLKALRAGRIEKPDALPAFVFETVRNLCLHHGRSAGRRDRAVLELGRQAREAAGDPLLELVAEERRATVRGALARLPEDDRRLLILMFRDGLDAAESGARLGLSPGTARVRKHRALRRLASLLGEPVRNEEEGAGTP